MMMLQMKKGGMKTKKSAAAPNSKSFKMNKLLPGGKGQQGRIVPSKKRGMGGAMGGSEHLHDEFVKDISGI